MEVLFLKAASFLMVDLLLRRWALLFSFLPSYVIYSAFHYCIVSRIENSWNYFNNLLSYLRPICDAHKATALKSYMCSFYCKSPFISQDSAKQSSLIVLNTSLQLRLHPEVAEVQGSTLCSASQTQFFFVTYSNLYQVHISLFRGWWVWNITLCIQQT